MSDPYTAAGDYYPDPLPVAVLVKREREGRTLCVTTEALRVVSKTLRLEIPIPQGYVTDWASIPAVAQIGIQPFGRHAWAALAHDWLYTVGEPNGRARADDLFLEKLEEAEVPPLRRTVMFRSVRLFGGRGYARAKNWWKGGFRDPRSGLEIPPPFAREEAFTGRPHGPRPWTGG